MAPVDPSRTCHAWKRQIRMLLAWAKGIQPLFSGASIQPKDGAQLDRKTGQVDSPPSRVAYFGSSRGCAGRFVTRYSER